MTDDERFLDRWNRRKTAARAETRDLASADPVSAEPDAPAPLQPAGTPQAIDPETLPDIDELDESSDFSIFMRDGVPEALRNRALRKLWQVDPAFGHIDGLLEYGEDYTGTGLADVVNTIYKVGKGMVSDEDEDAEIASGADGATGEDVDPPHVETRDAEPAQPCAPADGPLDPASDPSAPDTPADPELAKKRDAPDR